MQHYIIKSNDTLSSIAKKFKISLAQLIRINPEVSRQKPIYIGQIIKILDLPPVPAQLDTIIQNAELIVNDIYGINWAAASNKVNIIKTNMAAVTPLLQQASVPEEIIAGMNAAIVSLEDHVTRKKPYSAVDDVIDIITYMPDILDYFNVGFPTDVIRLNYLVRQIEMDVESNNWEAASNNLVTLRNIWEGLKPSVSNFDIANFDLVLNNFSQSLDNRNYRSIIQNARTLLEKVEALEENLKEANASYF
ncbi:LysM peptidoglycan-binding domain-containing protein [Sinanaerobacter sp. ZZT-01]|uniref:LysM peptidoglycan-binding domain-containing protein n=1 Tax=Sinanaerobacter sp. ZZT-01 TaxID=3111540 RepID=UPI002D7743A1|nr:LysM peptidoglycan-binding domain-containing protein [Sinanaerobacter sp. ZZT-01]WRR94981.1 LysM peptidoglycan-binding domain-containing protein [Sinanaerobacter sp. ZZT-01]